jgi:hypothetical protein
VRGALLWAAVVLLMAVLLAAAVLLGALAARHLQCRGVDAAALSDREVASYLGKGWREDPADGEEWLYPPGCVAG